ncbi:hypothetical protein [Streptomyces sp. HB132]|uniref:hypothetical protein n=1 Tax=Streptomyces sp. HB132 TaxID=767388 RepID=UPI0019603A4D|nr:hypothetical protein [Streptomyces sp. HB132]MBM7439631.1 hypothetical protein [Streptomyces sp. HB132]
MIREPARTDRVKKSAATVWSPSTAHAALPAVGFAHARPHRPIRSPHFTQEPTMADPAFVVTTIAVFALVAIVAKGVTKP